MNVVLVVTFIIVELFVIVWFCKGIVVFELGVVEFDRVVLFVGVIGIEGDNDCGETRRIKRAVAV